MIDPVQAVLLFAIVLLTILFIVLGIQVFYILKDFRETLKRTNRILDDVEVLTGGVAETTNSISGMFGGASSLGAVANIIKFFSKRKKKD